MSKSIRVRFAPSPTGPLHIGGVRTALFNYLFAKKHDGTFILRIEDTDQKRFVPGTEQYIIDALNWCGITIDEGPQQGGKFGPYKQSERKHIYRQYAEELVSKGKAYYAFDTAEALEELRKEHEAQGKTFIYNWHNREKGKLVNSLVLEKEVVEAKINTGEDYVIRFKSPKDQTLHLKDIIRGDIQIDTNILDDKVLFKSDGMPTYHLANIVDDHLMEITHVIRGEEWLPSLALHYQLYDAFGWNAPEFAHLPLILKPTGKGKLSKRDGEKLGFPVFPLEWRDKETGATASGYRESGYFPEAVVNFLSLLGWNPGTEQEIFTMEQLIESFDLDRVHKSGARFDPDKTKWFNHHYMQQQSNEALAVKFKQYTEALASVNLNYITQVVGVIKERATFISDFWELSHFFFQTPKTYDDAALKKAVKDDTKAVLGQLIDVVFKIDDSSAENYQNTIKEWITNQGIGFGKVMMPMRLSLVGSLQGPDVFQIAFMIGKAETLSRLQRFTASI
ncbi:glutamate--tRNA ligase [Paucihalobacter sp.]|uniref:glutamate--tRNA ligase n=1 Tax=Paucihalobacter sp. TaxID=2850405 RepID=UPI002FE39D00